ncbi:MAG: LuxR C-terminal-related transcriptional regulator [Acidimicrobiales bacterium]
MTAHPGSGKTTLLRAWYDGISTDGDHQAVWLATDTADDDPDRFVADLESLVERSLLPVVVFLDNFEVVRSHESRGRLIELVERCAGSTRFVVAQEHGTELPIARLRPNDLLTEIGDADLRLDAHHLEHLIAASDASVTTQGRWELLAATEGWALGIVTVLDRLGSAGNDDEGRAIARALDELSRSMAETIEAAIDREVFDLLVATSILEILEPQLCCEVAGNDPPILLDRVAEVVPFLTEFDGGSDRFRLHGLARRGLHTILMARGSPETVADRRGSAAAWLEANGELAAALDQYVAARQAEQAADLLAAIWSDDQGAVSRQDVERVGVAGASDYVPHIVTTGLVSGQTGDLAGLQQSIDRLAGADWMGPLPHGFSTLDSAVVALIAHVPRFRTAAELERLVEIVDRDDSSPIESQSLIGRSRAASALYLLGRFDQAHVWAQSVLLGHRSVGRHTFADRVATVQASDLLALLEHDMGDEAQARRHLDHSDELMVAYDLTSLADVAPPVDAFRALVRAVVGTDSVAVGVAALTGLLDEGFPTVQLHAALELARLLDCERQVAEAIDVLDRIDTLVGNDQVPPLLSYRRRILEESLRPRQRVPGSSLDITIGERSVLYLLADRTLGQSEISAQLGLSINTVKSHLRSVYQKFGVPGRAEAVADAYRKGLLVTVLPWGAPDLPAENSPGVRLPE